MKVIARLACAVGTSMTAVVLASPQQSPTPAASSSSPIVFSGAALIDGTGAPVVPNSVIVVRDGKIEGVGRVGSVRPPTGARTIDVTGKFVMPGLISTHAHVSDVQGIRPRAYTDENTRRQLQ